MIRYQRECFRILWQAFQWRALDPETVSQLASDQAETRTRVNSLEQDVKAMKIILSEIRGLSTEHRATAKAIVDQISKISGIGHKYIWIDVNKAFHTASYIDIPDEKWPEVQKWLQCRLNTVQQGKGIEQQCSLFDDPQESQGKSH